LVFYVDDPGLSLRSNPGLKLANAFGVYNVCGDVSSQATFAVLH
jgi:hypothetical protein